MEGPFLVSPTTSFPLPVIVSQFYQWRRYFPRVEPFYAVKCNPNPVILQTLAILGCNFDCASRAEIQLVQEASKGLQQLPDIIYANPCKARTHLIEAVCRGVKLVTFDNATEIAKCASISPHIELILRIMTDDRGSKCRLSSKFGAPRIKWRPLLAAAKKHGLRVVGVSFHVGSGCRDATRYEEALKDAREIFDMAEREFGMKMKILDIGGGFPGETHSIWNPAHEIDDSHVEDDDVGKSDNEEEDTGRFMYFTEIAELVAPVIDRLFPPEEGVRVIGEPGRYLVAACATLCCSVVSARSNEMDTKFEPEPVNDAEAAGLLNDMSREEEQELIHRRGESLSDFNSDPVLSTITEELAEYSRMYASQALTQQEFDVYNDKLDFMKEDGTDLLGPPDDSDTARKHHTVEGMAYPLVAEATEDVMTSGLLTLAAAGEAAVSGMVLQAVADSAPLQDDYAYYINDGVYGGFNNIMFDHAVVRPRLLYPETVLLTENKSGFSMIESSGNNSGDENKKELFASTLFGPTCDSIDVVARSVLLPKLQVGDWLYFQNMGAYTQAAASAFNGFEPSKSFYVCSIMPEKFEALIKGPEESYIEEKKE